MKDEIISYREMCDREGVQTLQRGMNYMLNPYYSVLLMSQRANAPYCDVVYADGYTIEYEGHDVPKTDKNINPKMLDQPLQTKSGRLTQNGLFVQAVINSKEGHTESAIVRIYEKLLPGVWSEKGFFRLVDYREKRIDGRKAFRFILEEAEIDYVRKGTKEKKLRPRSRIIPSEIKKRVWERDGGKCVLCGSTEELHFDHILPYSLGGTSIREENIRILCARHNIRKSNRIE